MFQRSPLYYSFIILLFLFLHSFFVFTQVPTNSNLWNGEWMFVSPWCGFIWITGLNWRKQNQLLINEERFATASAIPIHLWTHSFPMFTWKEHSIGFLFSLSRIVSFFAPFFFIHFQFLFDFIIATLPLKMAWNTLNWCFHYFISVCIGIVAVMKRFLVEIVLQRVIKTKNNKMD